MVVNDVARIEVRSYRTVFDLERRVYRIDGVRLNPGGVPVRGVVYAVVLAFAVAALTVMPIVGLPLRELPWPVRQLLLPGVVATGLTTVRIDGRPCHVSLHSLAGLAFGPRRVSCWRRAPSLPRTWFAPDIVLISDGSDSRLRRARFRGPGAVVVAVGHELRPRVGGRVSVRPARCARPERKVIVLSQGGTLDIHASRD